MFNRHRRNKDGRENECRYCRREKRLQPWLASEAAVACLLVMFCCGLARSQEQPPEYLGETYVRAAAVLMRPNASKAGVWFDQGFGTYPLTLNAQTNWALTVGATPYKYAWFRIRDAGTSNLDDYWVTEKATWTAYSSDKNVATLKAKSWQFASFTVASDYMLPDLPDPITWEERASALWIGHANEHTLLVVRKQDATWEWSVRGPRGNNAWTAAATREQAQAAAKTL